MKIFQVGILFLVILCVNCIEKHHLRKAQPSGDQVEKELLQLINDFRKKNNKTPSLTLHKTLEANSKSGLSDMIKSISHFHDHVGFESRIKNPKYELYGELLVKTSSKYHIAKQMLTFILTKKEIGAELLKDYNIAGISCQQLKKEWVCSIELAKYF